MKIFLFLCLGASVVLLSGCDTFKNTNATTNPSTSTNDDVSISDSTSANGDVSIDDSSSEYHNRQNSRNPTARGRP